MFIIGGAWREGGGKAGQLGSARCVGGLSHAQLPHPVCKRAPKAPLTSHRTTPIDQMSQAKPTWRLPSSTSGATLGEGGGAWGAGQETRVSPQTSCRLAACQRAQPVCCNRSHAGACLAAPACLGAGNTNQAQHERPTVHSRHTHRAPAYVPCTHLSEQQLLAQKR